MAVRASVLPLADPGHATLRLIDLDASPEGLTLSIQRQQGPDSHLADDGWRRTETWLQPARVQRVGNTLEFDLGPEICDRLAGVATVAYAYSNDDGEPFGLSTAALYQELAKPFAEQSMDIRYLPVRREGQPDRPAPLKCESLHLKKGDRGAEKAGLLPACLFPS